MTFNDFSAGSRVDLFIRDIQIRRKGPIRANRLDEKRIVFLATDGFEEVELTRPWGDIEAAGAMVALISREEGEIQGMNHDDKGETLRVDKTIAEVSVDEYDGLVLRQPGPAADGHCQCRRTLGR